MYNSKKVFSLLTTCIVGFSTIVSIMPVHALADTSKAGNTVLTYEGMPQPKEWGLSVPSQVNLCRGESSITAWKDSIVEIVSQDGSAPFKDTTRAHCFVISGVPDHINLRSGKMELVSDKYPRRAAPVYVGFREQGVDNGAVTVSTDPNALKDITIITNKDNSTNPHRSFSTCVRISQADAATRNGSVLRGTIAWTAEEK